MWVLYISDRGDRKPDGTGPRKDGVRVSTSLSAPPMCLGVCLYFIPLYFLCFFVILWFFFFCDCVAVSVIQPHLKTYPEEAFRLLTVQVLSQSWSPPLTFLW